MAEAWKGEAEKAERAVLGELALLASHRGARINVVDMGLSEEWLWLDEPLTPSFCALFNNGELPMPTDGSAHRYRKLLTSTRHEVSQRRSTQMTDTSHNASPMTAEQLLAEILNELRTANERLAAIEKSQRESTALAEMRVRT